MRPVVATVRRVAAADQPYVPAAPIPSATHGPVVELLLPGGVIAPVVHAWLSAHAAALMGQPAASSMQVVHRSQESR